MRDRSDQAIQDLLAKALHATDPVPDHVVAAAKEAFVWRTIDTELAELVYDSSLDGLVGVRSSEAARQVTFRAPGVEIEVMVMAEGTRRIVGQLVPPQQATVELHIENVVRETGTDGLGRFTFSDVPTGPVQIAVTGSEGARVVTEWVVF